MKKLTSNAKVAKLILQQYEHAEEWLNHKIAVQLVKEIEKQQLLKVTESEVQFPAPLGMLPEYYEHLFTAECFIMQVDEHKQLLEVLKRYKDKFTNDDKSVINNILFG